MLPFDFNKNNKMGDFLGCGASSKKGFPPKFRDYLPMLGVARLPPANVSLNLKMGVAMTNKKTFKPDVQTMGKKVQLFKSLDGRAMISRPYSTTAVSLESRAGQRLIQERCYDERCLLDDSDAKALGKALATLADFEAKVVSINYRNARLEDGSVVVDLGWSCDSRVHLTNESYVIAKVDDVIFERTPTTRAMPKPESGATEQDLRKHFNCSDDQWMMLLAWMTYVLVSSRNSPGGIPILLVKAQKGSGKTTICRLMLSLLDPQDADIRVFPTGVREMAVALQQSQVLCFDNLRRVSKEMSDLLCIASTGGYYTTRKLFSDGEEFRVHLKRAIIVNGLHDIVDQPDLVSRMVMMQPNPIADDARKTEAELNKELEANRGRYLGLLFSVISKTMGFLPDAKPEKPTRMADFCHWGKAVEMAMNWSEGAFMEAYAANQEHLQQAATVENLFVQAIVEFFDNREQWEGTPSGFLDALNRHARFGGSRNPNEWPQTAAAVGKRLKSNEEALKLNGIELTTWRSKQRRIRLARLVDEQAQQGNDLQSKVIDIRTGEPPVTDRVATNEVSMGDEMPAVEANACDVVGDAEVSSNGPEDQTSPCKTGMRRIKRRAKAAAKSTMARPEGSEVGDGIDSPQAEPTTVEEQSAESTSPSEGNGAGSRLRDIGGNEESEQPSNDDDARPRRRIRRKKVRAGSMVTPSSDETSEAAQSEDTEPARIDPQRRPNAERGARMMEAGGRLNEPGRSRKARRYSEMSEEEKEEVRQRVRTRLKAKSRGMKRRNAVPQSQALKIEEDL